LDEDLAGTPDGGHAAVRVNRLSEGALREAIDDVC
jgi:hypothetical protein